MDIAQSELFRGDIQWRVRSQDMGTKELAQGPLSFLADSLETCSCLPLQSICSSLNCPPISGCSFVPFLFLLSLSTHSSAHLAIIYSCCLSISIYPPINPSTHSPICPSSIYESIHPFISPFTLLPSCFICGIAPLSPVLWVHLARLYQLIMVHRFPSHSPSTWRPLSWMPC